MEQILQISVKFIRTSPGARRWKEMGDGSSETMFKQQATSRQISELESRLGISSTRGHQVFLRITNGIGGDTMQYSIYN